MSVIGSSSFAAQIYSGIQNRMGIDNGARNRASQGQIAGGNENGFKLPATATPRGDWVLSENASPQSFEQGAQRGSYLNIVV